MPYPPGTNFDLYDDPASWQAEDELEQWQKSVIEALEPDAERLTETDQYFHGRVLEILDTITPIDEAVREVMLLYCDYVEDDDNDMSSVREDWE